MYSINYLSIITGISQNILRDRAIIRNIDANIQNGIKFFTKKNAELLCGCILDEEYSELLFYEFLKTNSPISIEEAKKALCIDEDYIFKEKEYIYQSKLNFLSLKEL